MGVLGAEQLTRAHSQIRDVAVELAGELEDPDAFEFAMQACDHLRMASQVIPASSEYWLTKALEASLKATAADPGWTTLSARIQTLLACHLGIAVA